MLNKQFGAYTAFLGAAKGVEENWQGTGWARYTFVHQSSAKILVYRDPNMKVGPNVVFAIQFEYKPGTTSAKAALAALGLPNADVGDSPLRKAANLSGSAYNWYASWAEKDAKHGGNDVLTVETASDPSSRPLAPSSDGTSAAGFSILPLLNKPYAEYEKVLGKPYKAIENFKGTGWKLSYFKTAALKRVLLFRDEQRRQGPSEVFRVYISFKANTEIFEGALAKVGLGAFKPKQGLPVTGAIKDMGLRDEIPIRWYCAWTKADAENEGDDLLQILSAQM